MSDVVNSNMGQSVSDITVAEEEGGDGDIVEVTELIGEGSSHESSGSCNKIDNDKDDDAVTPEIGVSKPTPLQFNFINFTKAERCPIYDVNPVMLKKFIGHNVTVINLAQEKFHGCCLTIDPVSLSVILARRTNKGKIRIITLPGYHLKKIYVDANCVPKELCVSVNDLDIAELYHARSLLQSETVDSETSNNPLNSKEHVKSSQEDNTQQPASASTKGPTVRVFSSEEISSRKQLIKGMLAKNHLPVKENGEDLELPGGVKIRPPYTMESCDTKGNLIIQKKIGELLCTLPLV